MVDTKDPEEMDWFARVVHYLRRTILGAVDVDTSGAKQVLVFGQSGTGKSTLINALTGSNLKTGSDAKGISLSSTAVTREHNGVNYRIIDTIGLNEADETSGVCGAEALTALVKLLGSIEGGLNLMVMVINLGRIHSAVDDNYKMFVKTMTADKVPLIIVVTRCERETQATGDMQGWVERNRHHFVKQGIKAEEMVATTFITPNPETDNVENMQRKVNKSIELTWKAIEEKAASERVDFMKMNGGFLSIIRKMYNFVAGFFAKLFGAKAGGWWMWVSNDFVSLVKRVGSFKNDDDAKKMAKSIVGDASYGN